MKTEFHADIIGEPQKITENTILNEKRISRGISVETPWKSHREHQYSIKTIYWPNLLKQKAWMNRRKFQITNLNDIDILFISTSAFVVLKLCYAWYAMHCIVHISRRQSIQWTMEYENGRSAKYADRWKMARPWIANSSVVCMHCVPILASLIQYTTKTERGSKPE